MLIANTSQSEELWIVKDPGENGNVTDVAFPTSLLISYWSAVIPPEPPATL